ncbi:acyl-CoA thioesterase [Stenotrophomonas pictorum JCM 9942]|uniref:Acyl-CoA thioesterase n=1 Tax=Stenotrophomonas pictorum JCM 9942 TaxID=1236960 RepID=A0A0R0AL03_9GAMM|nr:thioesterase family protein [Stenotrophomonas pictorum]KRG42786.1 acyl-CoA thioesterase [Stenotrophomonas pictorum JCM 9942]
MPTLRELLSCFDVEEGLLLPDSWRQGRTAYGGIVSALGVAAAMQRHAGALPPLRSMQVTFIGPAAGLLRFMPTVLREGRSVVNVGVDVYADEDEALAARLSLVFGRARESAIAHDFGGELPARGPGAYRDLDMAAMPFAPAFTRNFQMRPAGGAMPVSGAEIPELLTWVRHRDATGVDPALALIAMGDAMPPAAFTGFTVAAPISSITWNAELLDPAPQGEWFLLRSFSQHAREGYSSQDMQVLDEQGRVVMRGRQSVAVFA